MNTVGKMEHDLIAELESAYHKVHEMEARLKEHGHQERNGVERFHTMSSLRDSETRYRRLFESAQDGILILDAESGAITDANPYITSKLGYSLGELTGKRLWEIGAFADVKDSKAAFEELKQKDYIRYNDLPLKTKDGQSRQVEFVSNVYLVNGLKVIQCNIRDISERREMENRLEEAREELEATRKSEDEAREYAESIINTVREPLIALDEDLRVVTVSRSFYEFFKVKPEETVGQLIYDLGNKQWDIPKLRELLETILPQRTTFDDYEVEHDFSTIGRRIMLLNARQVQRVLGKERIILLAIEDISERKKAEEKVAIANEDLAHTNEELEQFDYSVSHDLRGPLLQIAGFTRLLEKYISSRLDEKARRYLDMITAAAGHGVELVDDILDFSRMRRADMVKANVSLKNLVHEVIHDLHGEMQCRDIDWQIGELSEAYGDTIMLRRVFNNLIGNALKYSRTRARAHIEVSSIAGPKEVVCFVRDNGIGFEMEYARDIFRVFQRLHRADEFEGNGVGLAIVRQIIERHGGRVWAEGALDKGATFYFSLPLQHGGIAAVC